MSSRVRAESVFQRDRDGNPDPRKPPLVSLYRTYDGHPGAKWSYLHLHSVDARILFADLKEILGE